MAQDRLQYIFDIVQGKDTVTIGLKKIDGQATKSKSSVAGLGSSFKGLGSKILKVVGTVGALGAGLASIAGVVLFKRAIQESKDLENALIGLRSVASNTGNDVSKITEAAKELAADGMIPLSDVSGTLKSLLASGMGADEAIKVFKTLRNSASFNRQGQLSLAEAVRGAADGIKNQNSIMVDNAGITKNLSVLQKEYAASIGTTAGMLTEQQKRQAIVNGILREGALFAGDYAKSLDTFSGATTKAGGSFRFLLAELGNLVVKNKAIILVITAAANSFQRLTKSLSENRDEAQGFVQNGIFKIIDGFATLVGAIGTVKSAFSALFNSIQFGIDAIVYGWAAFVQSFLKTASYIPGVRSKLKGLVDSLELVKEVSSEGFEDAAKSFNDAFNKSNIFDLAAAKIRLFSDDIKKEIKKVGKEVKEPKKLEVKATRSFTDILKDIQVNIEKKNFKDALGGLSEVANLAMSNIKASFAKADFGGALGKIGPSLVGNIAKGAEGARQSFVQVGSAMADAIIPGLGQAVGPIIDLLAQGPEKVKETLNAFFKEIPKIIENIIISLPILLQAIAEGLENTIIVLAEKADIIIEAFVRGMVKASPRIAIALSRAMPIVAYELAKSMSVEMPIAAVKFVAELVKEAPKFIESLIKEISGKLGGIFGGGGDSGGIVGTIGGAVSSVGDFFGFAKGGSIKSVRGGIPGQDSVPARLMPGELVVDRSTNDRLGDFLNNKTPGGQSSEITNSLLIQILNALSSPQTIDTKINIDSRVLASAMLELKRTNARLA